MRFLLHLTFLALVPVFTHAGTLVTRDGQTLTGDLTLTDSAITLTPKSAHPRTFPLTAISQATFAPLQAPDPNYPDPRRDDASPKPGNVLTEYFADKSLQHPQLTRYESSINTHFDTKSPPDPSIPPKCGVRHTARLVAPSSQDYTFTVETYGPVRLWIDDRLRIDQWNAKGPVKASAVATLSAQKPSTLRLESVATEHAYLARLAWAAKTVNPNTVPRAAFLLPDGANPAPQITLVNPQDDASFRNPEQIDLEVQASAVAGGSIKSIDLFADNQLIAALTQPPFRYTWRKPPVGNFKLLARATDDRGVSAYAGPIDLAIADAGANASLPEPWGQQTLGKKDRLIPGTSTFTPTPFSRDPPGSASTPTPTTGTFRLIKAGGQVTEDDDSPIFVYQPVTGDFQLTAHLSSLTPNDNTVGPLAGLLLRENMGTRDRFVALVTSPQTTTVARRADYWGRITTDPRSDPPAPWIRISRMGNRVRTYTSPDGQAWSPLATDRLALPERCFVGLCAMSRNKDTPATAAFDHVSLTPGPPALTHTVEGLLFRSGTFLAAEINGLKDGTITYTRNNKRQHVSATEVAQLVYKPTPAELTEKVPPSQTGALLANGDFVEGELKEVSYKVTISNLVFGPRTLNLKTGEVLALYLNDPTETHLPYTLTTTDGSTYQSPRIQPTPDTIQLQDPTLGPTTLPLKDLAQLKLN
jgi:hypothetical protein